jgi:nucleotide-binding universal stress UspA family protein
VAGKVLVGYLETEPGRDALALGAILARARDAELVIATVEDADALAATASEQGADIVALGSTHRGPLGRIVPGTTMERLLASSSSATAAVAVAPPGFADRAEGESAWRPLEGAGEDVGMRVVGVGYDGSRASRAALDHATGLARRNGASLRVYSVVHDLATVGPDTMVGPRPTIDLDARRAALERAAAALPDEVRALPLLLRGLVADELARAASLGVDLLVVGTHARHHLDRFFHRSVAGQVALMAPCPVLICPTPVTAPLVPAS